MTNTSFLFKGDGSPYDGEIVFCYDLPYALQADPCDECDGRGSVPISSKDRLERLLEMVADRGKDGVKAQLSHFHKDGFTTCYGCNGTGFTGERQVPLFHDSVINAKREELRVLHPGSTDPWIKMTTGLELAAAARRERLWREHPQVAGFLTSHRLPKGEHTSFAIKGAPKSDPQNDEDVTFVRGMRKRYHGRCVFSDAMIHRLYGLAQADAHDMVKQRGNKDNTIRATVTVVSCRTYERPVAIAPDQTELTNEVVLRARGGRMLYAKSTRFSEPPGTKLSIRANAVKSTHDQQGRLWLQINKIFRTSVPQYPTGHIQETEVPMSTEAQGIRLSAPGE